MSHTQTIARQQMTYDGIGDGGSAAQRIYGGMQTRMPPKMCVGRRVGQGIVCLPAPDSSERGGRSCQAHVVGYSDRLAVLPAHSSPGVIDVYIDNARYKRVRWQVQPQFWVQSAPDSNILQRGCVAKQTATERR